MKVALRLQPRTNGFTLGQADSAGVWHAIDEVTPVQGTPTSPLLEKADQGQGGC